MNPVVVKQTGVGASGFQALNPDIAPFQVSFGCVVTGTATFSIQYTYDNPNTGPDGVIGAWPAQSKTPNWFDVTTLKDKTANADGTLTAPVFGWRLNLTAGTGTVTVTVIQADMAGG